MQKLAYTGNKTFLKVSGKENRHLKPFEFYFSVIFGQKGEFVTLKNKAAWNFEMLEIQNIET